MYHRTADPICNSLEASRTVDKRALGVPMLRARSPVYPNCYLHGCPCGYYGDSEHDCTCSMTLISRYQKRFSAPLFDRIDILIEVPRVPFQKLTDERRGEPLAAIRARVEAARTRQTQRLAGTKLTANADMGPTHIREFCH